MNSLRCLTRPLVCCWISCLPLALAAQAPRTSGESPEATAGGSFPSPTMSPIPTTRSPPSCVTDGMAAHDRV